MDTLVFSRGCVPYRHLWNARELSAGELDVLLDVARRMPELLAANARPLQGRHLAVLGASEQAQPFGEAMEALGARVSRLGAAGPETAPEPDAAKAQRLLGRLYDAIDCCGVPPAYVEALDAQAGVPVFNGLAEDAHPLRGIATLLAMRAWSGRPLDGLTLALQPGTRASSRELGRLARLAGVRIRDRAEAAQALPCGAGEASPAEDEADFVFEAPRARRPALRARGASASEQGRLAALEDAQRQVALQALVLSALA